MVSPLAERPSIDVCYFLISIPKKVGKVGKAHQRQMFTSVGTLHLLPSCQPGFPTFPFRLQWLPLPPGLIFAVKVYNFTSYTAKIHCSPIGGMELCALFTYILPNGGGGRRRGPEGTAGTTMKVLDLFGSRRPTKHKGCERRTFPLVRACLMFRAIEFAIDPHLLPRSSGWVSSGEWVGSFDGAWLGGSFGLCVYLSIYVAFGSHAGLSTFAEGADGQMGRLWGDRREPAPPISDKQRFCRHRPYDCLSGDTILGSNIPNLSNVIDVTVYAA
jgi:hypothetical protein